MAQRTEKEETEFKVLESLTPTTTATETEKCFNASIVDSAATLRSVNLRSSSSSSPVVKRSREIDDDDAEEEKKKKKKKKRDHHHQQQQIVNRCSGCRRKVGLTGFRCRCGELFCSEHRYSDRHDCSYDYKTVGREAIARENPVVKAAKMVKV